MENKKSNTNVKTTMDFFKQKRAKANSKKLFSHIEINSDINNNKPSFATSADFNSTNQSIYKSDIFQIDTYLDKTKDINMYDMFQKKLSSRIEKYKIEIIELEKKCESIEPLEVRIENAKKSIRRLLDINYNGVDDKIIEEFVEKIIVHKDYFEWKLNFMNDTIKLEISGKSKKDGFLIERE